VHPGAGKRHEREGGNHSGDAEDDHVPPHGCAVVVAELLREIGEHAHLDLVHQLEEPPCGEGDHQTDHHGDHEEDEEPPAPDGRDRV
jgi:hypothetical protein